MADEIDAMKRIAEALEPLDEAARKRALDWACSRFQIKRSGGASTPQEEKGRDGGSDSKKIEFETFAELFEAASPKTDSEKALVASYWAQTHEGQSGFGSQTLNAQLKDLGHGVGNITEALTSLKNEKPALVLQLKKSGTSKQARKTYKLTQEGIRKVQSMMQITN